MYVAIVAKCEIGKGLRHSWALIMRGSVMIIYQSNKIRKILIAEFQVQRMTD